MLSRRMLNYLLYNNPFEHIRPPRDLYGFLELPRQWQKLLQEAESEVTYNKDKFQAQVDVQQFKPEEITVKVKDNVVTVEGRHEEKQDQHGFVSRHFVRKFVLPEKHDLDKLESKLSSDGILTVTAPKIDDDSEKYRTIPITQTGEPTKAVEDKKQEDK